MLSYLKLSFLLSLSFSYFLFYYTFFIILLYNNLPSFFHTYIAKVSKSIFLRKRSKSEHDEFPINYDSQMIHYPLLIIKHSIYPHSFVSNEPVFATWTAIKFNSVFPLFIPLNNVKCRSRSIHPRGERMVKRQEQREKESEREKRGIDRTEEARDKERIGKRGGKLTHSK